MHFVVLLSALVACAAGVPVTSTNPKLQARVIGGSAVDITKVPFQLSLMNKYHFLCGAVIIGETWAVTAAHCVDGVTPSRLVLRAGSPYRGLGSTQTVKNVIPHELYNASTLDNDIALLEVHCGFSYSEKVKDITLIGNGNLPNLQQMVVSGWGLTEDGAAPLKLHWTYPIEIKPSGTCSQNTHSLTYSMLCALGPQRQDSCQGDSGGPLFAGNIRDDNGNIAVTDPVLIGIVSKGPLCGTTSYGGIYTSILYLRTWIRDKTGI